MTTKSDAIEIYLQHVGPFVKKILPHDALVECGESAVTTMAALGILKLDEPKISDLETELPHGYIGKVRSFMRKFGLGGASPIELERALDAAGLRIVEK